MVSATGVFALFFRIQQLFVLFIVGFMAVTSGAKWPWLKPTLCYRARRSDYFFLVLLLLKLSPPHPHKYIGLSKIVDSDSAESQKSMVYTRI